MGGRASKCKITANLTIVPLCFASFGLCHYMYALLYKSYVYPRRRRHQDYSNVHRAYAALNDAPAGFFPSPAQQPPPPALRRLGAAPPSNTCLLASFLSDHTCTQVPPSMDYSDKMRRQPYPLFLPI